MQGKNLDRADRKKHGERKTGGIKIPRAPGCGSKDPKPEIPPTGKPEDAHLWQCPPLRRSESDSGVPVGRESCRKWKPGKTLTFVEK